MDWSRPDYVSVEKRPGVDQPPHLNPSLKSTEQDLCRK